MLGAKKEQPTYTKLVTSSLAVLAMLAVVGTIAAALVFFVCAIVGVIAWAGVYGNPPAGAIWPVAFFGAKIIGCPAAVVGAVYFVAWRADVRRVRREKDMADFDGSFNQ